MNQDYDEVATSIEQAFTIGAQFSSIDEIKKVAKEFGKQHNIVLAILWSNKRMIYRICKYDQEYRAAKNWLLKQKTMKKIKKKRNVTLTAIELVAHAWSMHL